jgi:hypothetical protein
MYLWGPDADPVPVRWFFAAEGAQDFPHAHSFWNVDWEIDHGYKGDNDLIGPRGNYYLGGDPVGYAGTNFHGPAQAYLDGGTEDTPELTTDEDGALPDCRLAHFEFTAAGGQAQGGLAAQGAAAWLIASGGQAQGGVAVIQTSTFYDWAASGGQAQGGVADQGGDTHAGEGRVTQDVAEVLRKGSPLERVTQVVAEVLRTEVGFAWIAVGGFAQGGTALQAGATPVPPVRVTQYVVEVLRTGSPLPRVTQEVVEVIRTGSPAGRVTQEVVEVLRT